MLYRSCSDLFPTDYFRSPNHELSLPMDSWMHGPLYQLCSSRLQALEQSEWLEAEWIRNQWACFKARRGNWQLLWHLVVLGELAIRTSNSKSY